MTVHSPRTEQRSLETQREEFSHRRGLAMPLAGTLAWGLIGLVGALGTPFQAVMTLYIATGSIFYLGMGLSRLTGENFFAKGRPKNEFDRLFMAGMLMSLLVFTIALPWASQNHESLPLSFGVLAGLMWLPYGWIIQHWIGAFHAIARALLCVGAWYAFPTQRFVARPRPPGGGASRLRLAFRCGESTGSSCVVGVGLSSGAGMAGIGVLFG